MKRSRDVEAAVDLAPTVERVSRHLVLAADFLDGEAGVSLAQNAHDLIFLVGLLRHGDSRFLRRVSL